MKTDSDIIMRRRVDNVLWDFRKKHPDVNLKTISPNNDYLALQGYSSSDMLTIKMRDGQKMIQHAVSYCKLLEDWYEPDRLSITLEWMYKELKGD